MLSCLDYPLDIKAILRKKKTLKKQLQSEKQYQTEKNIAILGGSTTSEIRDIIELFLLKYGINPNFYESGYNRYYEDAVFENVELRNFRPDIIYLHTTNVNITQYPSAKHSVEEVAECFNYELEKYRSIWTSLLKYDCAIIQNNFDLPINRTLGNLDCYDIHGAVNFIIRLNSEFAKSAAEIKNLYINDINYLSSYIGLRCWFDKTLWHTAKYALSYDAIPQLAHNISKIIGAIFGQSKKCLVVDLDNTCWNGTIGDDGLGGIRIGPETAVGEAHTTFQDYVKELKNRGVALAVCSKNDFVYAKEGLTHPNNVLEFKDFTAFKANWSPKSQNIIEIAKEINIGTGSLVFIDDDPMERNIVSSQVPDVETPNVGDDIVNFIDHVDKNGYFETVSLSAEDINRDKYYKDNKKRINDQALFKDYDEFLASLEMTAEIGSFLPKDMERITQLINKTNQFNLTTKRYTFGEIENILNSNSHIKLYGKLADKYGDHGLIAITLAFVKEKQCHIDLCLMSCRVLKRDMEFAMLDTLVDVCRMRKIDSIIGYYYRAARNKMVSDLYKKMGFELISQNCDDSVWKLQIDNYENKNRFINVILKNSE